MKKTALFIAFVMLVMTLFGCNSVNDPNITTEAESTETQTETEAQTISTEIPKYIDADQLALRSYELYFSLTLPGFNTPDDIPLDAMVQYCMCHIFYKNLCDMPNEGIEPRSATIDDLQTQIIILFGSYNGDLKQSSLYNPARDRFEMWEPHYGAKVYYNAEVENLFNDEYRITTTFYTDENKTEIKGKTTLVVYDQYGQVLIKSLNPSL